MATVTHVEHEDGSHSIGVKDGKAFVPFVTVMPGHYASLLEGAQATASNDNDSEKGGDQ